MDWLLRGWPTDLGVTPPGVGESFDVRHPGRAAAGAGADDPGRRRLRRPDRLALPPRRAGLAALQDVPGRAPDRAGAARPVHAQRGGPLGRPDRPALLRGDGRRLGQPAGRRPVRRPRGQGRRRRAGQGRRPARGDRLALAQGLLARDDGRSSASSRRSTGSGSTSSPTPPGRWPRSTSPSEIAPALADLKKVEPSGDQSRLGAGVRQVLTELRGVPPTAIVLLTDGQTTEGETRRQGRRVRRAERGPALPDRPGRPRRPPRHRAVRAAGRRRRLRRRPRPVPAQADRPGFAGQELTVRLKQRCPGDRTPRRPGSWRSSRSPPRPTASRPGSRSATGPSRPGRSPTSSRSTPSPASCQAATTGSRSRSTSARRSSRSSTSTATRATSSATSRPSSTASGRSTSASCSSRPTPSTATRTARRCRRSRRRRRTSSPTTW